jgi:hypothetical protein
VPLHQQKCDPTVGLPPLDHLVPPSLLSLCIYLVTDATRLCYATTMLRRHAVRLIGLSLHRSSMTPRIEIQSCSSTPFSSCSRPMPHSLLTQNRHPFILFPGVLPSSSSWPTPPWPMAPFLLPSGRCPLLFFFLAFLVTDAPFFTSFLWLTPYSFPSFSRPAPPSLFFLTVRLAVEALFLQKVTTHVTKFQFYNFIHPYRADSYNKF